MTPPVPELRYRFTVVAHVDAYLPLEQRDAEHLEFITITGGPVQGEIEGEIVPGGGDWCLVRADESYQVEARYLIRTTDGAVIDVVNVGILRHLAGESGGDPKAMGYFLTTPRFRTADPRYQWLTRSVFVGRATANADNTTIDIFEALS